MYRYLDIVENQRVISYQIKNSQVVTKLNQNYEISGKLLNQSCEISGKLLNQNYEILW
jgi:hypothetical protein